MVIDSSKYKYIDYYSVDKPCYIDRSLNSSFWIINLHQLTPNSTREYVAVVAHSAFN
jgi:hypothetical protein